MSLLGRKKVSYPDHIALSWAPRYGLGYEPYSTEFMSMNNCQEFVIRIPPA